MELVDELAFPVPFQVISDLLDDADRSRDGAARVVAAPHGIARADGDRRRRSTLRKMRSSSWCRISSRSSSERRKNLGDDLLSGLLVAEESGDRLSDGRADLVRRAALRRRPRDDGEPDRQRHARAAAQPGPAAPVARRPEHSTGTPSTSCCASTGPVQLTVRVPMVDVTYGPWDGRTDAPVDVPKGTIVMTLLGAANHDASIFDDPHALRLDRPNANRHVALSAGIHYCLGASLAKLEAQVAIGSLIRRFPNLELAGDPGWRDRLTIRGVDRLPLTRVGSRSDDASRPRSGTQPMLWKCRPSRRSGGAHRAAKCSARASQQSRQDRPNPSVQTADPPLQSMVWVTPAHDETLVRKRRNRLSRWRGGG